MPVYAYKGVGTSGRSARGFVDAESARAARTKLRRDGIVPTELREGGPAPTRARSGRGLSFDFSSLRSIPGVDLAISTRQLSTLVGAGVPLVSAFGAVADGEEAEVEDAVAQAAQLVVEHRVVLLLGGEQVGRQADAGAFQLLQHVGER